MIENAHHFLLSVTLSCVPVTLFGFFGLLSSLLGCWKHVLIVFWVFGIVWVAHTSVYK